jgi:DNA-binding NarL/FixJ family response regulator
MTGIYIVSKNPIFGEGIEEMLRRREGVEILGFERDFEKAIEQIVDLRPGIVIFDCNQDQDEINIAILQILKKGVEVKIIRLDIQSNRFMVYKRENHEVRQLEDLFQEIE